MAQQQLDEKDDDILGRILAKATADKADITDKTDTADEDTSPSDKEAAPAAKDDTAEASDKEAAMPEPKDTDMEEQQQKDAADEIAAADNLEKEQPEEKAPEKPADKKALPSADEDLGASQPKPAEAAAPPEKAAEEPPWMKLQRQAEQAFGKYQKNLEGQRLADLSTLPGRYLLGMKEPESLGKANEALASMPVASLEGVNSALKNGLDIQQLKESNDPNSAISTFARQQAGSFLKHLDPTADLSVLKNATAANLEKLGLTKGMGSLIGRRVKIEGLLTKDGHPINQDTMTGNIYDSVDGHQITDEDLRGKTDRIIQDQYGNQLSWDPVQRKLLPITNKIAAPNLYGGNNAPPSSSSTGKPGVPPSSAMTSPSISQPQPLTLDKIRQLDPNKAKEIQKTMDTFQKSKEYTEPVESMKNSQDLKDLLQQGDLNGKDLMQNVAIKVVRAAGISRLTQQEILASEGGAGLLDQLNRFRSKNLEGKISDSDRELLNQYADILEKSAKKQLNLSMGAAADRMSNNFGLRRADAVRLLGVGSQLNRRPAISNLPPVKSGFTRMLAPDNTVHDVPTENADSAKQKYQFQEYNQ